MRPRLRPRAPGPSARFALLFDAFSSREPVSTSLESAMEVTRMLPDVVTFWHGPLDALRHICLRSQVAPGHKFCVLIFVPIAELHVRVASAEGSVLLPHAC